MNQMPQAIKHLQEAMRNDPDNKVRYSGIIGYSSTPDTIQHHPTPFNTIQHNPTSLNFDPPNNQTYRTEIKKWRALEAQKEAGNAAFKAGT